MNTLLFLLLLLLLLCQFWSSWWLRYVPAYCLMWILIELKLMLMVGWVRPGFDCGCLTTGPSTTANIKKQKTWMNERQTARWERERLRKREGGRRVATVGARVEKCKQKHVALIKKAAALRVNMSPWIWTRVRNSQRICHSMRRKRGGSLTGIGDPVPLYRCAVTCQDSLLMTGLIAEQLRVARPQFECDKW